jgi:hypothetical protein
MVTNVVTPKPTPNSALPTSSTTLDAYTKFNFDPNNVAIADSPLISKTAHAPAIGKGLFCTKPNGFSKGDIVVPFHWAGKLLNRTDYLIQVQKGKGGYAVHLNKDSVIDFYDIKQCCPASMVNSSYNAVRKSQDQYNLPVRSNVRL